MTVTNDDREVMGQKLGKKNQETGRVSRNDEWVCRNFQRQSLTEFRLSATIGLGFVAKT